MTVPVGWLLALTLLAVARATRLITTDAVLDRPRAWVQQHAGPMLAYLLGCPWCLSVWLGLPAAAVVYAAGHAWWVQVPVLGLALSYGVGVLEQVSSLIAAKHDLAEAMTEVERAAVSRPYDRRRAPADGGHPPDLTPGRGQPDGRVRFRRVPATEP